MRSTTLEADGALVRTASRLADEVSRAIRSGLDPLNSYRFSPIEETIQSAFRTEESLGRSMSGFPVRPIKACRLFRIHFRRFRFWSFSLYAKTYSLRLTDKFVGKILTENPPGRIHPVHNFSKTFRVYRDVDFSPIPSLLRSDWSSERERLQEVVSNLVGI